MRKAFVTILLLLILPTIALANLEVHFLDVGQGDCAVVLCDGGTMVIDGGPGGSNLQQEVEFSTVVAEEKRSVHLQACIHTELREGILQILQGIIMDINPTEA